ncbi:SCY1 protein kinase [Polytolypa hystricis UAMH7299]|uniref:SCY1 protein kinase n=1 Tax=Polytolypa hystricis (strain UAMH7299) TaxID=1447883 RepID=A0A2B7Z0I2_POLH7|nr:SCY1 protein kinase [Polytolypa hystricis UAMH7299]
MFSSALKSFNSNISSNYQISPHPAFISGPWKVFDGKKKNTGNAASVFIFEKKTLDNRSGNLGSRSGGTALKKAHEEVVDRLRREASSLARLRHPSILQILEPVEDTRNGGLMFATEPVTASLAGLLQEKDDQERANGVGGRPSRFMVEDADGTRRRRHIEVDELEIQKGLLQVGKGLEFLHESAGLVHGNLNPEAVFINIKSDWKISGLGFASPAESGSKSSLPPLALSEVLYYDPRLPRSVQLDMDYTSPDFAIDSNVSPAADLFSLGLIIVALYNSPHMSPVQANNNISTYKKLLNSSSTIPSQSNRYLSSQPIPKDLASQVLPRLIARRPAHRLNAREFQQSQYFDNVLISTIRFLESFPEKTPSEKSQFMRGLGRVLPDFPSSVLERKVLVALLEESKDKELLPLLLQNVFKIIKRLPSSRRVIPEKVLPKLKEIFMSSPASKSTTQERDNSKDAGLMVVLENMSLIAENCPGGEFKEDVLPLVHLGLESPTHSLVDASMRCLPMMLPILDFSTVKDDIFPPIAAVFSRTSSLTIKVRGLEAFVILCGGSASGSTDSGDDLSGIINEPRPTKSNASSILDKFTVQEKIVPLLKAMKTKEPAVMMAALNVFRQIGQQVDTEFLALEVLPIMWSFSLGPLLDVQQFTSFMDLMKSLSSKVEREHTRKLQSLASTSEAGKSRSGTSTPLGMLGATHGGDGVENTKSDFERLVLGKEQPTKNGDDSWGDWNTSAAPPKAPAQPSNSPSFSWSSTTNAGLSAGSRSSVAGRPGYASRSVTPDTSLSAFPSLAPTNPPHSASATSFPALQPTSPLSWGTARPTSSGTLQPSLSSLQPTNHTSNMRTASLNQLSQTTQPNTSFSAFTILPPPSANSSLTQPKQPSLSAFNQPSSTPSQQWQPQSGSSFTTTPSTWNAGQQQKQGLDKYESLL